MFDTLTRMGASAAGAYEIERSLRFNSGDTAYLNRTPSGAGNLKTWTVSFWAKISGLGVQNFPFSTGADSNNRVQFAIEDDYTLNFECKDSGSTQVHLVSNRLFRDPSAWYHFVVSVDTTQGTASNRVKIYVNGVQETSFSTETYPSEDADLQWNKAAAHYIGKRSYSSHYMDGYITEFHAVDGTALTHTSFGETNEDTGQWIPKGYGGSHGTNGFYLNFSDNSNTTSSTLGDDDSANTNDWTPNNFSVAAGVGNDSVEDTPTNNFCTLNPIIGTNAKSGATPANGALDVAGTDESTNRATFVFGPGNITSGKWYWEITNTGGANGQRIGLSGDPNGSQGSSGTFFRGNAVSWFASNTYKKYTETMETSSGSYYNGDVTGVAYNADDDEIKYYKNGTLTLTDDTLPSVATTELHPVVLATNSGSNGWPVGSLNFGQRAFAHTPPTGYEKLCTANLPEPTIKKGSDHFNTVIYSGDGNATQAITGVGFQPDLLWIKGRNTNYSNLLYNSIVGAGLQKGLNSNETRAEGATVGDNATYGYVNAFDSDGFSVTKGSDSTSYTNGGSSTYVAWSWKESTTAGFDIVSYTGDGNSPRTNVTHNLGVAPDVVIVKRRNDTEDWIVGLGPILYGSSNAGHYLKLNTDAAEGTGAGPFNSTNSTSNNIVLGSDVATNGNGDTYIAYCFSGVKGYSKFGTYIGNGNADGTFVYTGFRPAYVMTKRSSGTGGPWNIIDNTRETYNVRERNISANTAAVEDTSRLIDFLSNGFKLRNSGTEMNNNTGEYIYMAFAETPFKYANAR